MTQNEKEKKLQYKKRIFNFKNHDSIAAYILNKDWKKIFYFSKEKPKTSEIEIILSSVIIKIINESTKKTTTTTKTKIEQKEVKKGQNKKQNKNKKISGKCQRNETKKNRKIFSIVFYLGRCCY